MKNNTKQKLAELKKKLEPYYQNVVKKSDSPWEWMLVSISTSPEQEKQIFNYLRNNISKKPELAAVFLMFATGLRLSEACSVKFGDIHRLRYPLDIVVLHVDGDYPNNPVNVPLSCASYCTSRDIPFPQLAIPFIEQLKAKRLELMKEYDNWDPANINDLYIAYSYADPFSACKEDAVSNACLEMFTALDMLAQVSAATQKIDISMQEAIEEDRDSDYLLVEKDPCAYILRISFSTHMTILNLSPAEIMYLVGHMVYDKVHSDYFLVSPDLKRLAKKMAMRPILNEVKITFPFSMPPMFN